MYDNQADKFVIAVKSVQEPKLSRSVQTHYYAYEPELSGQRKNTSSIGRQSGVKRLGLGALTTMDWHTQMRRLQVPLADRLKE